MHILVISPTPSFPADQGNRQRVRNVCKALQERGAQIHFGYFPREWSGRFSKMEHLAMTEEWDFYDTIVPSKPFVHKTADRHFGIDDWWDDAIGRFITYKCSGMQFDACIVNYAFFSKAFDFLPPNVLRILDTHDRLSGRREMFERNNIAPEFFYTSKAEEKIALDRADVVLAINPEEAAFFRSITRKAVVTLGHVAPWQKADEASVAINAVQRVGFLGSSNSVNVKNLNDFFYVLASVAPRGIPGVEFHIYGNCCSRLMLPPELEGHVKLYGHVEKVEEFYSNIDCVFVPFTFGTGQKIKLIEALSYGKPLIATANASEGSGSMSETHLLDSSVAVVEAIRKFGSDEHFRMRLAEDTARAFSAYENTVNAAIDALFRMANVNAIQLHIDRSAVARHFNGMSAAQTVDIAARVISVISMLDLTGRLAEKDAAIQTLLDGIVDAQNLDLAPSASSQSRIEQAGATQVFFSGLSAALTHITPNVQVRIHLPEGDDLPPAPTGSLVDVYVDRRPDAALACDSDMSMVCIRTMPFAAPERTFARFDQLVVLVADIDALELAPLIAEISAEIGLRIQRGLTIWCVDNQGRRGRWNGESLSRDEQDETVLETIRNARAMVLAKPSIMLSVGTTHIALGSLHRVLMADGGPLVSLFANGAIPMDGELVARSAHEAAIWISLCFTAPAWANVTRKQLNAGVSAGESDEFVAHRLRALIDRVKAKLISDQAAELATHEVLIRESDVRRGFDQETPAST